MDVSFVPSLEHLCCEKIVMLLLTDSDLQCNSSEHNRIKSEVMGKISELIPSGLLQRKLEKFIKPLLREVKDWTQFCEKNWTGFEGGLTWVSNAIPNCRHGGTIDKEKFMYTLIKNPGITTLNRFILACNYSLFDDVLDLWYRLDKLEKAYLRNRSVTCPEISDFYIKLWVEWLQSNTDKDWNSFVAVAVLSPVLTSNIYLLKRVILALDPAERSLYLLKALTKVQMSSDVMRFCLSIMTEDERELVYEESPIKVFRCILSWPLRNDFVDFANKLWPYITENDFCAILRIIREMIRGSRDDYLEFIEILKTFWAQSPGHYKKFAEKDFNLYRSVDFFLKFDSSQESQRESFIRIITI